MRKLIRIGVVLALVLMALWEFVDRTWPDLLPRPGWSAPSQSSLWIIVVGRAIWEILFLCTVLLLPVAVFQEYRVTNEGLERRKVLIDAAMVAAVYAVVIAWLQLGSLGPR